MGRTLAWFGLGMALGLGALVRWTWPAEVEDLRPRPDALEYEEAARNLVAGEGYCLVLDGGRFPPRYPPGFSLLLVPAMWLTGGTHGSGIWMVLLCALAGIAGIWTLGLVAGGPASAAAAGFLLALAPLHVRWSRAVMADVPAATVTTLLVLAAIGCLRGGARPRTWLGLGAAFGLGALLRFTCTLVVLPVAFVALVGYGITRAGAARLAALGAGVVLGLLPSALYGLARFGSPLATGYDYWVRADFFGWSNVVDAPTGGGTDSNLVFYARELAGLGALYPPSVALLATLGLILAARRPGPARVLAGLTAGTVAVLLAAYLPFFWQWDRFLLPALPLVLALAAVPLGTGAPPWLRLAGVALVVSALAGGVTAPGAFDLPGARSDEVAALRDIAARVEPDAVLVARGHVVLVSRLFHDGTQRLWMPLDRCEHRTLIRAARLEPSAQAAAAQDWVRDAIGVPFDAAAAEAAIRGLLASGRPVYYAPILFHEVPFSLELTSLLHTRFVLEPIAGTDLVDLVRVRARPPHTTRIVDGSFG